jgi:hypothetical protein
MNTAEQLTHEIKRLPEPLQRELLDYAHFLSLKAEQDSLMMAQASSLDGVWDNEEDDVWLVSD